MKSPLFTSPRSGLLACALAVSAFAAQDNTKAPGTKGTDYEAQLPADATRLKIGDKAPDFDLLGIDGKKHKLAEYTGGEVLVVLGADLREQVVSHAGILGLDECFDVVSHDFLSLK